MDYRMQNSLHQVYSVPQPKHVTSTQIYSYYNANPNSYPNQIIMNEEASSAAVATGGVVHTKEHYTAPSGYEGVGAVAYGDYQSCQQTALYPYTSVAAAETSFYQEAKRKIKIQSKKLDLESKKLKIIEEGAAADAVRVCTTCNVVCNSNKVFVSHLAGEKHALKTLGRARAMLQKSQASDQLCLEKMSNALGVNGTAVLGASSVPNHFLVCEVCKIECNSQEALNSHNMGKKHRRKLQSLHETLTTKPSTASMNCNATVEDTAKNELATKKKPATKEDLETKKEKVLIGGAAKDAIKICAQCNVVCNSEAVYSLHIAGKKHQAMIKNQA